MKRSLRYTHIADLILQFFQRNNKRVIKQYQTLNSTQIRAALPLSLTQTNFIRSKHLHCPDCVKIRVLFDPYFRPKDRIFDSVLIWENTRQRKSVLWHILRNALQAIIGEYVCGKESRDDDKDEDENEAIEIKRDEE